MIASSTTLRRDVAADDRRTPSLEKVIARVLMWALGLDVLIRALWAPRSDITRLLDGEPTLRAVCLGLMTVSLAVFALDILVNDLLPRRFTWARGARARPASLALMAVAFLAPLLAAYAPSELSVVELYSIAGRGVFFLVAAVASLRAINRRRGAQS